MMFSRTFSTVASRSKRANFSTRIRRRRQATSRLSKVEKDEEASKRMKGQMSQMLDNNTPTSIFSTAPSSQLFVPTDQDGNEISMNEYLELASLSPWVPCPDPVAIRVLDIANASSDDIHYELGSGDGRMNFHAIDSSYNVKKSIGIDIDASLIEKSNLRKARIHPAPEHLQFICADLLESSPQTAKIWDDIEKECTILTMYFVEDALMKIKPLLEKKLINKDCKIITIGYAMNGWEPSWNETVLGLNVHMYDMKNVDTLFNAAASESLDTSEMEEDEELNMLSRQTLKQQEEQEGSDVRNPFADNLPGPSTALDASDDDDDVDGHWDWDETEEFDNENQIKK